MSLDHFLERLEKAKRCIELNPRDIKVGLKGAAIELVGFKDMEVPGDYKSEFDIIKSKFTLGDPTAHEMGFEEIINGMEDEEAEDVAKKIISLHNDINSISNN